MEPFLSSFRPTGIECRVQLIAFGLSLLFPSKRRESGRGAGRLGWRNAPGAIVKKGGGGALGREGGPVDERVVVTCFREVGRLSAHIARDLFDDG